MEWLQGIAEHVQAFGLPVFLVLYLLAVMLPIPAWPLTVAAGAMFGVAKGFCLALAMSFLGSVGAFLVGRYLLRRPVQNLLTRHPKLKAVDGAMRDGGWKAVWLLQMSPAVPFGIQNYFLGASKVDKRSYLAGTSISGLPSSLAYVSIGAGARWIVGIEGTMRWFALAGGLLVTIGLSVWIGHVARRRLQRSGA